MRRKLKRKRRYKFSLFACSQFIDFIIGSLTNGNHINDDPFVYDLIDRTVAAVEKFDCAKSCQITMKLIPMGMEISDQFFQFRFKSPTNATVEGIPFSERSIVELKTSFFPLR